MDASIYSVFLSNYYSFGTKLANEQPVKILANQEVDTNMSTSLALTNESSDKTSSSISKSSSSTSKSTSSRKSSLSTSQTSSAALSNENPYIGLTNGSPGMSANRYFRGIEWGQSDRYSQHKKMKEEQEKQSITKDADKNTSNEVKITANLKKDEAVPEQTFGDTLVLGAAGRSSSLEDNRSIQNVEKQQSVTDEQSVVKAFNKDSTDNNSSFEHRTTNQEHSISDQNLNDKSFGKSCGQSSNNLSGFDNIANAQIDNHKLNGKSLEKSRDQSSNAVNNEHSTTKSRDRHDVSASKKSRDYTQQNSSVTSQSKSTAQAQSTKVKPVPKPRGKLKMDKNESRDQGNGMCGMH